MGEPLIKNLDEVIRQRISSNQIITKMEVLNLLEPGENYLSEMMKVEVNLKNKVTEAETEIHAVGKCVTDMPGSDTNNGVIKQAMNDFTLLLFKREILFYKEVVPAIRTFLKSMGASPVDYFPEYYGSRINLTGGSEPDKDAVLLLENLHTSGYQNMNRHEGFDFAGAKLVLKDLAHMHAVCIAMKLLDAKLFEDRVKKHCNAHFPKSPEGGPKDNGPMGLPKEVFVDILKEDKDCSAVIPTFEKMYDETKSKPFEGMFDEKQREPFATLVHMDMWLNNTMQQVDSLGRPIKNKFVDFQLYSYGNPARDLQFFLQTSVQLPVLKTRFDSLMKFYHDNFTKVLSDFGCDVAQFSYENFLEEVKATIPDLLVHGSFMVLLIVFVKKGAVADPSKADKMSKDDLEPMAKEKYRFLVREAYERGWLSTFS